MATTTDTIKWGEQYDIEIAAQDANGDPEPILNNGQWSVAIRITRDAIGGKIIFNSPLTIANDVATISIDTGSSIWTPGTYYYDVRVTKDGDDAWTDPIELILQDRNTPNT